MKIGILSLGNLGSAVATLLANNGHTVMAFEHDAAVVDEVNRQHCNSRYLPGIVLPQSIQGSTNIAEVLQSAEIIFNCIPSRFINPLLESQRNNLASHVPIVNMAKGIDARTRQTATRQLAFLFPDNPLAMLAGPSLANEFIRGVNTVVVAASKDRDLARHIAELVSSEHFSVMLSDDIIGVELGGILKNIYAIGLGAAHADGKPGLNFIGAFLTQALHEMRRIGTTLGATPESFYDFSGIGDLITTAMSSLSHNYHFGQLLGQGMTLQEAADEVDNLPEGVNTLRTMAALASEQQLDTPLLNALTALLDGSTDIRNFKQWG